MAPGSMQDSANMFSSVEGLKLQEAKTTLHSKTLL